jgi:hypothetical protein
MKRLTILYVVLHLLGCDKAKEPSKPLEPTDPIVEDYIQTAIRVMDHTDQFGYVIVKGPYGEFKHQGDALWRSGLALAAMPCGTAMAIRQALATMVNELSGGLWRHPTLAQGISMDGALAFYLAMAARVARCPEETASWQSLMASHLRFMAANGDRLNPDSDVTLPAEFDFVRDQVAHKLGLAGEPHSDRQILLEAELWAWTLAVRHSPDQVATILTEEADEQSHYVDLSPNLDADSRSRALRQIAAKQGKEPVEVGKAACFRVNLAWMSLRTIEHTDRMVTRWGRDRFCEASQDMGLTLVDSWCGRGGLAAWLEAWKPSRFDFQFQRCNWEDSDCDGDSCGGVDKLHAMTELYDLF